MKKLSYIFAIFAIVATLAGCSKSNAALDQLKKAAADANRSCPIDMGMIGKMTAIEFNEDANAIQYTVLLNEELVTLESIVDDEESVRRSMSATFTQSDNGLMLDLMIEAGAGVEFIMRGNKTGAEKIIRFSVNDIKEIKDNPIDPTENYNENYESILKQIQSELPTYVTNGMYMNEVLDQNGYLVYVYSLDDNLYDISLFDESYDEIKAGMIEEFVSDNDLVTRELIKMLKALGRGIKARYVGTPSGNTAEIVIESYEL